MNQLGKRIGLWLCAALTAAGCASRPGIPTAIVRDAEMIELPGADPSQDGHGDTDCNIAAHWDGDKLFVFFSLGHPFRSSGPDFRHLSKPSDRTEFDNQSTWIDNGRWIEATYKSDDGLLYGWYHNEPHPVCGDERLTAPRIGAAVSGDNGMNWKDLGIVLTAPADSLCCETKNYFFCGGNGDFCVNLDNNRQYFYFFISTYNRDIAEQGVSVARMAFKDLAAPVGKVTKWRDGGWTESGLGGHVTPIVPVRIDWHRADADAFWGPSVHWNTHLHQWVMLLNRAKDKNWNQKGIYISFNADLSNPRGWSEPTRILQGDMKDVPWYPQVLGVEDRGTDKLAGRTARLFVKGRSRWEITFLRPGERP